MIFFGLSPILESVLHSYLCVGCMVRSTQVAAIIMPNLSFALTKITPFSFPECSVLRGLPGIQPYPSPWIPTLLAIKSSSSTVCSDLCLWTRVSLIHTYYHEHCLRIHRRLESQMEDTSNMEHGSCLRTYFFGACLHLVCRVLGRIRSARRLGCD